MFQVFGCSRWWVLWVVGVLGSGCFGSWVFWVEGALGRRCLGSVFWCSFRVQVFRALGGPKKHKAQKVPQNTQGTPEKAPQVHPNNTECGIEFTAQATFLFFFLFFFFFFCFFFLCLCQGARSSGSSSSCAFASGHHFFHEIHTFRTVFIQTQAKAERHTCTVKKKNKSAHRRRSTAAGLFVAANGLTAAGLFLWPRNWLALAFFFLWPTT